jgi:hypothetical protein
MNAKAKIQSQLSAYLDGELDEAQLRQVEEALENDGDLRAELADLAAARKLLRDLPAEKPPLDLVSRVLAEAERSQLVGGQATETSPDALRWIRYAASAAVLLVAATVGMVIAITLCSPEMYKDNLTRREEPAGNVRSNETNVAVVGGKRTGRGEEVDNDDREKLATRGLLTEGTPDGRELKERGGGELSGRAGIDGKLGKPDDNGRSRAPGPGGPEVPGKTYDGDTTISAGTLTKSGTSDAPGGFVTKDGTSALGIATKGGMGGRGDNRNEAPKGALAKGHGDNADAVSGPFDNVESMSRVLAGDTTNNTIIYTDRLDQTQQQVEKVLGANGIAPVVTRQSKPSAIAGKAGGEANQARGNFYLSNRLSPAQVQYEAYVTPEQMAKVQKDLDSLRARQNVSQDVPALAYNRESAKNAGWNYKKDQAGKDGYVAGKVSEKPSGIAIARADGDSGFRRKIEAQTGTPVAKETPPAAKAADAPVPPAAEPAPMAPPGARVSKPVAAPEPAAPAVETAPPAPVAVVAPGRARGEEEEGQKYRQDVRAADKTQGQLAQAPAKDQTQLAAKAPESGSGSSGAYRGQSANEPLRDTETRRQVAQTRPATPAENIAAGGRAIVPTPSVAAKPAGTSVAEKPAGTTAPNQAANTGSMAQSDVQSSTRPAERLAGQVAGPVGWQRAAGTPNPPTAPPAPTQAPVTIRQGDQVVQVGVVRQSPLTQSGGTVAVQITSQPGQALRQLEIAATARVQRLVITLNYRQAGGEAWRSFERARLSDAAASQAAPSQDAPAANKAAQEAKQEANPAQSK